MPLGTDQVVAASIDMTPATSARKTGAFAEVDSARQRISSSRPFWNTLKCPCAYGLAPALSVHSRLMQSISFDSPQKRKPR